MEILKLRGISKIFFNIKALDKFDFQLLEGELHSLVGENGAGKSTLMNIISGGIQKDEGEMWLNGEMVELESPKDAKEKGISMVHQEIMLVPKLSVVENVFLGSEKSILGIPKKRELLELYNDLVEEVGFYLPPEATVESLDYSQKQWVQILKAMTIKTKVIIMDEPTESLTMEQARKLYSWLNRQKGKGKGIIYISHKINEVLSISDRVTVIRDGRHILTAKCGELDREKIIENMLGMEIKNEFPRKDYIPLEENVFEIRNLTDKNFNNVSFSLKKCEILVLYGLVGAGHSEIASAIFDSQKINSGDLYLNGKRLKKGTPKTSIENKIVMVQKDRIAQGLMLELLTLHNISISNLDRYTKGSIVVRGDELKQVSYSAEKVDISRRALNQKVKQLSGGNQQKTVFARWINKDFKIMILDDPTRGVDVKTKANIYQIIGEFPKNGKSVILVSSDIYETLGMCDRVIVFQKGRIKGEFNRKDVTVKKIESLIKS